MKSLQNAGGSLFQEYFYQEDGAISTQEKTELFGVCIQPVGHNLEVSRVFIDVTAEFTEVFVEEPPDSLPSKRDYEFETNLRSNELQPVRPVIRLSSEQLVKLKKHLQSLLKKELSNHHRLSEIISDIGSAQMG